MCISKIRCKGVDWTKLAQDRIRLWVWKHGTEFTGPIKAKNLFGQLRNYRLLKKGPCKTKVREFRVTSNFIQDNEKRS
jgi:hypothetical protein